jgi:hypothetical protein
MFNNPYPPPLSGAELVRVADSLRGKGSFEDAVRRLDAIVARIADKIVARIPGLMWEFLPDPNNFHLGLSCRNGLPGDIGQEPESHTPGFNRALTSDEFAAAAAVVREEARTLGATHESSLFNEQQKRDYEVEGGDYRFNLGQIEVLTLEGYGGCHLYQRVLNEPSGQVPSRLNVYPT